MQNETGESAWKLAAGGGEVQRSDLTQWFDFVYVVCAARSRVADELTLCR